MFNTRAFRVQQKNPAYYTLQGCFQGLVNPMGNPGAPASIFGYPKNGEKCWRMWKELFRLSEDEHLGPAAEETLGFLVLYQQHEVLNPQAFLCRAWGLDSDVGLLGFFSSWFSRKIHYPWLLSSPNITGFFNFGLNAVEERDYNGACQQSVQTPQSQYHRVVEISRQELRNSRWNSWDLVVCIGWKRP